MERCSGKHMCTHLQTHTCTNIATSTYPGSSSVPALHLACFHILCFLHTEEHEDQLWVNINPLYSLSISLSLSLPVHLLASSPLSLPLPSHLVVTYVVKILVSRLQTVHIVLSLTFFNNGQIYGKTRGNEMCVCVFSGAGGWWLVMCIWGATSHRHTKTVRQNTSNNNT